MDIRKETEFGDKICKKDIYQGILLILGIAGMIACATFRGCQEITKHNSKTAEKAKQIQIQPHHAR